MEGWNDCPLPVPTSNQGAPTLSATLKARKRMSRLPVVSGPTSSTESSVSGSSRSLMMPPIPSTLPPPPRGIPKAGVTETQVHVEDEKTVDFTGSEAKLRALVEAAAISGKERDFFTKRLVDAFPTLAEPHKKFISLIVDALDAKEHSGPLKTQVLNYMMVNSGVSTWGVPLKKLVETFK